MAWIENLKADFDGFTLEIPRWDFPETGISCIWGASGSGKSTSLQIISGLIQCPSFRLSVGGDLISELPLRERNIGYVFQDYLLFPHLSTWENIIFPAQAKNLLPPIYEENAFNLLSRLGLEKIKNQKASTLSGGESQRVALARALVTRPRMVLLDEPLSALDEKLRNDAREIILELSQQYRVPFIFVTHDIRDVRTLSQSLLVLSMGKSIGGGLTQELLLSPPSLDVARLIPENQVLNVEIKNGNCFLAGQQVLQNVVSVSRKLVAKKWAFEVESEDSSTKLRGRLVAKSDMGYGIKCVVKLTDGQTIEAWSKLPMKLDLGHEVKLNLEQKGLVLF